MVEWGDERDAMLRKLWDADLSTSQIGERMGISKNAVIGRSHRIGLPKRPSPIKRGLDATPKPRPVRADPFAPAKVARTAPQPAQASAPPDPFTAAMQGLAHRREVERMSGPVHSEPRRQPEKKLHRGAPEKETDCVGFSAPRETPPPSWAREPERKGPLPLIDLRPNECRYAVSGEQARDYLFCAKRTEPGCPWCSEHRAKVWTKRAPPPLDEAAIGPAPLPANYRYGNQGKFRNPRVA